MRVGRNPTPAYTQGGKALLSVKRVGARSRKLEKHVVEIEYFIGAKLADDQVVYRR